MPDITPAAVAAHNSDVAAKQAAQDINGKSTAAADFANTGSALDALAAQVTKARGDDPGAKGPQGESGQGAAVGADADAAADAAATDKAATDKAAADKAAADKAAADNKRAADIFKDAPALPAGASPKSSEAFATIKLRAAEAITKAEEQAAALKKELDSLKESAGKPSPEQEALKKEIEEHRTWRARLDVEFDPRFKAFDKTIAQTQEFVYAQLRKSPVVNDKTIEEIKKYGGPENVNLDKLFEKIGDSTLRRIVEAKVSDIEQVKYQKDQAISAAKGNVQDYLRQRQTELQQAAVAHNQATSQELGGLLSALDWMKEKPATEEGAKEHNEFVNTLREQVKAAGTDDSPKMRAVLITGMAQLFYLQRIHDATTAKLASAEKALADVTAKFEKVKASSVTRLRESGAATGAAPITPKVDGNTRTVDALDALAQQVSDARKAQLGR